MDVLIRIKRLVVSHQVLFTEKAEIEMARDSLTPELVYEAILNAPAISRCCVPAIRRAAEARGFMSSKA